jgi:hypothetical protein
MHRALQLQVLSWLAALATLGAASRPNFDTILFAVAFVFGALVLHVRERLFGDTKPLRTIAGQAIGTALAWSVVSARAVATTRFPSSFPKAMSTALLAASAIVPTGILVIELVLAGFRRASGKRVIERARDER